MGAGYDTTWFQLQARHTVHPAFALNEQPTPPPQEQGLQPTRFIEVDFADVTRRKVAAIQATPQLSQLLDAEACFDPGMRCKPWYFVLSLSTCVCSTATGALHSRGYHVVPCDLRDLGALEEALSSASWDPLAPTYVLSECVLVYMEPAHSAALVRWFGERCPRAVGVVYEQIHPDDAFGKQMVRNLQVRSLFLMYCMLSLLYKWRVVGQLSMSVFFKTRVSVLCCWFSHLCSTRAADAHSRACPQRQPSNPTVHASPTTAGSVPWRVTWTPSTACTWILPTRPELSGWRFLTSLRNGT